MSVCLLLAAGGGTVSMLVPWRSAIAPAPGGAKQALHDVLDQLAWSDDACADIALLSVPPTHADNLEELSADAGRAVSARLLIGIVGSGVIGDGAELERVEEPGMSLLAGCLPPGTRATPFVVGDAFPNWSAILETPDARPEDADEPPPPRPAFLLFADPSAAVTQIAALLNDLSPGACVAGGLSCPPSAAASSIALYEQTAGAETCRALPVGSLAGVHLRGPRFAMHCVTAQGAAPVGPSFQVTAGGGAFSGNLVTTLDGRPAMEVLQELAAPDEDARIV